MWRNEPHQFAVARIRVRQFDERESAFLADDAPAADKRADRRAEIRLVPDEHQRVRIRMIEQNSVQLFDIKTGRKPCVLDQL